METNRLSGYFKGLRLQDEIAGLEDSISSRGWKVSDIDKREVNTELFLATGKWASLFSTSEDQCTYNNT
jgi:hypothetical protein